jgi:hypothetical protein
VISIDSLTVIAMTAVLGLATWRVQRRGATVALAGLTGLFAALWLGEFASTAAAAVVAIVSLGVLTAGLAVMAVARIRRAASTPRARRTPPDRSRDQP